MPLPRALSALALGCLLVACDAPDGSDLFGGPGAGGGATSDGGAGPGNGSGAGPGSTTGSGQGGAPTTSSATGTSGTSSTGAATSSAAGDPGSTVSSGTGDPATSSVSASSATSGPSSAVASTSTGPDPQTIVCADQLCSVEGDGACCWNDVAGQASCIDGPPGADGCETDFGGFETRIECLSPDDCPGSQVCCGVRDFFQQNGQEGAWYVSVTCESECDDIVLCTPGVSDCECIQSQLLPTGTWVCSN